MLHAIVHPADIQDRDGGILLLATLFGMYPFLKKLFADGGYQGPEFHKALTKLLPQLETEIIKRSDHAKGFVLLPRRWVVERTRRPARHAGRLCSLHSPRRDGDTRLIRIEGTDLTKVKRDKARTL